MPYTPKTLLAFVNAPNAVHEVGTVRQSKVCRDLLLYHAGVHSITTSPAAATS